MIEKILIIYLIAVNVAALILYGADKRKAIQGKWRIRERTLVLIAVIGGSIGALVGMLVFRHKTKHWSFRLGIPLILIGHILLAVFIYNLACHA